MLCLPFVEPMCLVNSDDDYEIGKFFILVSFGIVFNLPILYLVQSLAQLV